MNKARVFGAKFPPFWRYWPFLALMALFGQNFTLSLEFRQALLQSLQAFLKFSFQNVQFGLLNSWRHRQAGASEVLLVCDKRLALVREFAAEQDLDVHAMLAELRSDVDWVLVEGFKHGNLPKVEIWRAPDPTDIAAGKPAKPLRFPEDPQVVALATNDVAALPVQPPAHIALLDLNQPAHIADWMLANASRFEYQGVNA